jgi:hypothetical protein
MIWRRREAGDMRVPESVADRVIDLAVWRQDAIDAAAKRITAALTMKLL